MALAATTLSIGYTLGLSVAKRHTARTLQTQKIQTTPPLPSDENLADGKRDEDHESDAESDSDEEFAATDGDLGSVKTSLMEPCKLVCDFLHNSFALIQ